MLLQITIYVLFGILCTYFFINVCTNKGMMSDVEFYVSVAIFLGILVYVCISGKVHIEQNILEHKRNLYDLSFTKSFTKSFAKSFTKSFAKSSANYILNTITIFVNQIGKLADTYKPIVIEIYSLCKKKLEEKYLQLF